MSGLRSQVRAWWPVVAYAGIILAVSSIPAAALPDGRVLREDKIVHFAEYAVLGALLVRGFALGRPALRGLLAVAVAAAMATAFGSIDELYQSMTPGRQSSAWDLLADTAGGFCGAALALLLYRGRSEARAAAHDREVADGHHPKIRSETTADR